MNTTLFKYPRTPHLPWSPGWSKDDIRKSNTDCFEGRTVVVTEKMDGENTTLYPDTIHARSLDGRHHPSRNWVKDLHGKIHHHIPKGWRICGENLYAQHTIAYQALESYFYLFSIWDENNHCLPWDDTLDWAAQLGLVVPKTLYQGIWDESLIQALSVDTNFSEGYVVRLETSFHYDGFKDAVAKWVRQSHVQTDRHWMHATITPNILSTKEPTNNE